MILLTLSVVSCVLALFPAAMFFGNLRLFRAAPGSATKGVAVGRAAVSLLIPARNEAAGIADCLAAVLANREADLEVIVLDDQSTDDTAAVVREIAAREPRVRLEAAPPLPGGWCGKQHACFVLSKLARHDLLMFIDADVRLADDAVGRAVAFMQENGAALVSGFPRQVTGSLLEAMLLPLIQFVLLGYLPMGRMRASTLPAYGAGCGQWFLARRDAYESVGGHAAIRLSLHDGIQLPRAFRRQGLATDFFDATDTASCRMYHGARQTWQGLAKNATEAMAAPAAIVPWTFLLLGGQVFPWLLLIGWGTVMSPLEIGLCAIGAMSGIAIRAVAASRFAQPWVGVALHPVSVLLLIVIQWDALIRKLLGKTTSWRGRAYAA